MSSHRPFVLTCKKPKLWKLFAEYLASSFPPSFRKPVPAILRENQHQLCPSSPSRAMRVHATPLPRGRSAAPTGNLTLGAKTRTSADATLEQIRRPLASAFYILASTSSDSKARVRRRATVCSEALASCRWMERYRM